MEDKKKAKTTKTTKTTKASKAKNTEAGAKATVHKEKTEKKAAPKIKAQKKAVQHHKDKEVRAVARFVPTPPRKLRFVMDTIRGKKVSEAMTMLKFTRKAAAADLYKVLKSAVANAENNFKMDADALYISKAYVDPGPVQKRYLPRAMGRASLIFKRSSHITVAVKEKEQGG